MKAINEELNQQLSEEEVIESLEVRAMVKY